VASIPGAILGEHRGMMLLYLLVNLVHSSTWRVEEVVFDMALWGARFLKD
jgi:hypothetical protein